MGFEKVVVVDGKGHMMGRLAGIIAKELMNGQHVVVVRCEEINISGSLFRNKLKFAEFLNRRTNTNPKKGPIHFRAPSRIFYRSVRGMVNDRVKKGCIAMDKLKVFDGVPHPYDKIKRKVVPDALRAIRLRPGRKYCRLGDLSTMFGWRFGDLIGRLEDKRKEKSAAYYATKKERVKLRVAAVKASSAKLAPLQAKLTKLGY